MTIYRVKKINLKNIKTIEEYWDAVNKASIHYCNGLEELKDYCGGRLRRQRGGYSGINGDIEYVATPCR